MLLFHLEKSSNMYVLNETGNELHVNDKTNLPHVKSNRLVVVVFCTLAVTEWRSCIFLSAIPLWILQQRHQDLSSLTHFKPKLWIVDVAAAVAAAASGNACNPAADVLVIKC